MKRKSFKTLVVCLFCCLLLVPVLFSVVGCSNNKNVKYNAVLYDDAVKWIREDFAGENLIDYFQDGSSASYTFLVDSQEKYNSIFLEDTDGLSVDFDNQMLAVYTFISFNYRNNYLANLELNGKVLTITYEMEKKKGVNDTSQPYQRWFVVRLDKLDVESVVFKSCKLI
ncbi:MAG: hypothetical protein ACI4MN_07330 [Candidatus Coproplasma sp.]